ncbi:MAG: 16S rRNA (adenine(1518)-N(6)/adenine(1519)-N(6))-dimethyltransferase RsmA, partial [Clostridiales bacterium]|nr:16S rRNA (adenine(1518)-N(6)/adenine(1519)-N(6))-dimethyltransferase RsmA [Clostridiales bacterium]
VYCNRGIMVDIEQILTKHKFKYKKALGQNFIFDDDLLDEIAEAGGADGKCVVEIGAGSGRLSRAIAKRASALCAFEIDETLFPILGETLGEFENVRLFSNNVLELGIETVDMLIGEPYIVIANLPYYITTPLIFLFLKSTLCGSITCLVQKEVADRICAIDGSDFGALSASVQAVAVPRKIRDIKSWDFTPMPEVDSTLIRLDRIEGAALTDELDAFIKICFTQKRKPLVNNLTTAGINKQDVITALDKLGFAATARAEELGAVNIRLLGEALGRVPQPVAE